MERNDSSSVISSLQMDYGDSDEEENDSRNNSITDNEKIPFTTEEVKEEPPSVEVKEEAQPLPKPLKMIVPDAAPEVDLKQEAKEEAAEASPVDFISDDDDDTHPDRKHHHRHHHHHHHHQKQHASVADSGVSIQGREEALKEAVAEDSPASQGSTKPGRKATRLVSYGPDEDLEDEESSEEEDVVMQEGSDSPVLNASDASILSRSVQNVSNDDIQIPPEPSGKCHYSLQKKIEDMYEKMGRDGLDLNRVIQNKKNFRNPSIYEKLIDYCHIDEKGTNFPVEIYDPHLWGKDSFYDELDKAQRKDMERREKEKKERTKIEFLTGTKKSSSQSDSGPEEKKRKTKWDAQPGNIQVQFTKMPSASQNPGVVNLTAIATGTKSTVIPAVGSLSKKSSSSSGK